MAKIEKFEDIEAWKKARELTQEVYKVTGKGPFSKDYGLKDQIRKASVSMMSHVADGFERGGNKEFGAFLSLAKGCSAQVRSHLYVALDEGYLDDDAFQALYGLADDAGRLIGGFLRYIEKSSQKGGRSNKDASPSEG